jgi:pilus assembly protein Flp/PilA
MVRGHAPIQVEETTVVIYLHRTYRRDEQGASAVEYGLLIAGIASLIVATVFLFGGFIDGMFQGTCDTIAAQQGNTC